MVQKRKLGRSVQERLAKEYKVQMVRGNNKKEGKEAASIKKGEEETTETITSKRHQLR